MRRAAGGDLREVRNAQHLEVAAECAKSGSHRLGNGAADAGVHLIEDEGLSWRIGGGKRLEREHDA